MIFNPDQSPITTMAMTKDEKLLLCGTKDGILIVYNIDKIIEYKKSFYFFDDEITSISINDNLNMISVSSKDGFVNLYTLPFFKLVRTIYLNKNNNNSEKNAISYANHIFLSSSPLASITLYNNSKRLFKSFTINGEFICEINENNICSKIKSPIIYTNNSFQDILLYGTDNGFIKMRKFPEMTLVNSIEVFHGEEINTICISLNKKTCYVWSSGNTIAVIKDSDINRASDNKDK
jgi:WD40 repeat protein